MNSPDLPEPPPQANGDELERLAAYELLASDILTVRERIDQEVVWASASLRTQWGLVSDASRGQRLHWHALIHPDDRAEVLACYEGLRAGHPAQLHYRVQLPDGRLRHCEETAKASLTPRGQSRLLMLTRDVTAHHEWRQEQRRRVALELRLAQLERAAPGEPCLHCDGLRRMLHELLLDTRVDGPPPEIVTLNLADEISGAVDLLRLEINRRETLVCITLECPEVAADRCRLQLVLRHLLENALRFGRRHGQARIDIRSWTEDGFGHVEVADNGIGFEARQREKIFEPFQQLAPEPDGRGMGLTLVRRAVESMGGRVSAEGLPGQGARFRVVLPLPAGPLRATGPTPFGNS